MAAITNRSVFAPARSRSASATGTPTWVKWARRAIFYVALIGVWQALSLANFWPDYTFPSPGEVASTLWAGVTSGVYIQASLVTLQRLAVGYAISMFLGVVLGLLIGRVRWIDDTVGSLILGLQALPSVCWLPLAILWIGLDEQAIIFVVIMGALFSITLGVSSGIKNTPPIYMNAARTLGAGGLALAYRVILPSALPAVVGGLKQGWSFAWRSLMAGELLYYSLSLGNLLETGRDLNNVAQVVAVMLVIVILGVVIDTAIFAPIERSLRSRWGLSDR